MINYQPMPYTYGTLQFNRTAHYLCSYAKESQSTVLNKQNSVYAPKNPKATVVTELYTMNLYTKESRSHDSNRIDGKTLDKGKPIVYYKTH